MKNYKKLKANAQLLRDKTNFSTRQIASFLGVSQTFIQENTTDSIRKDVRIIEDWVCEYDDIGLIGKKHRRSNIHVQQVIDRYLGKNENNFAGLKSKV